MAAGKTAKRGTTKTAASKFDIMGSATQIWLAGLGALTRAQHEGPKLFKTLVAEGSKVQDRTSKAAQQALESAMENIQSAFGEQVAEAKGRAQDTWDNVEKIFQSRVQKAIHQMGVPTTREINALTRKVEELAAGVEKLSAVKAAKSTTSKVKSASMTARPSTHRPAA